MIIFKVKVITRAKKARVVTLAPTELRISVTAPALDGKANRAVIASLADHFQVKQRAVRIVRGRRSREKIIEIKNL